MNFRIQSCALCERYLFNSLSSLWSKVHVCPCLEHYKSMMPTLCHAFFMQLCNFPMYNPFLDITKQAVSDDCGRNWTSCRHRARMKLQISLRKASVSIESVCVGGAAKRLSKCLISSGELVEHAVDACLVLALEASPSQRAFLILQKLWGCSSCQVASRENG